jgi:amino acid adenylation domain-containing protein
VSGLVHRALIDTAQKLPDKPVFRIPGDQITFAELVDRAARLANTLAEAGVRPGDRVGVHFRKSIDSAVAIYAVLQAGAAYVPLDPAAPADRTCAVLRQCGARVLLTQGAMAARLPADTLTALDAVIGSEPGTCPGARCIAWADALSAPPAAPDMAAIGADDLAYVIFTSGSTGAPKGITHTHRSAMAYSTMAGALYDIGPNDCLTGISPLHFDMSTLDYLCGPRCGATTTIIPDAYLKLPASLTELVAAERITLWYSVPFALTRMLLAGAMEDHDLTAIRWVLFGGEPFAPKHLAALMRALPRARFSNVYGPAECNQCTYYHLPPDWTDRLGQPSIGTDCPHAQTRVVDGALQPVAQGEIGELIVRAPSVMQGYWDRPDLTEAALARLPGQGGAPETWLRTGDMVSRGADGLYAFHGRADRMAKIRGYRVGLDEIEDVLSAHQEVEEASAFPVALDDMLTTIQAAVTLRPGASVSADDLRDLAKRRLPPYALPERIDIVMSFPRTSSGKIDWKTLGDMATRRVREARHQ